MKRREAILKTTWILGSAVFGPGLLQAIQGCQPKVSEEQDLMVLNGHQFNLAQSLSDTILPKTDTPSASEVQVPQFLDLLLRDVFDEPVKQHLIDGINLFDEACRSSLGKSFVQLDQAVRNQYLEEKDKEVMSEAYTEEIPFYYTFKQLVIILYFSSADGVKQNLDYRPIPGPFQGDMSLDTSDRIMIGNKTRTYL